ncbi:Small integral membrane protein (fragment) [Cupriavidus taiwanensis]|uniref:Small integral membrane protein n=1 Tax=Cupriavidus taiwanensis TaxID=164546 RepID=A0A375JFJ2_9BURK
MLPMCALSTLETVTAVFCWMGSNRLWCARHDFHMTFQRAKGFAIAGLTLGFLTWQVAFMSIGGEWFGMWMSKQWNGMPDAFGFFLSRSCQC